MEEEDLPNPAADSSSSFQTTSTRCGNSSPLFPLENPHLFCHGLLSALFGSPLGLPLEIIHPCFLPFAEDGQDLRGAFQQVSVQNDQIGPGSHIDTSPVLSPMIRAGVMVRALDGPLTERPSHGPSGLNREIEGVGGRVEGEGEGNLRLLQQTGKTVNHVVALFPFVVALVEGGRESPGVRRDGSPGGAALVGSQENSGDGKLPGRS